MADIASGLKAVGVPTKGRVGVFGANCPEWMLTMQARGVAACCFVRDTARNAIPVTSHALPAEGCAGFGLLCGDMLTGNAQGAQSGQRRA